MHIIRQLIAWARRRVRGVSLLALAMPTLAGALPLAFEANHGQVGSDVRFVARGTDHVVHLRDGGARIGVVNAGSIVAVIDIRLAGARGDVVAAPRSLLPGKSHYFRDDDGALPIVDVPTYDGVTYAGVYPGIDLVYHGDRGALEYDFELAPRADPRRIALYFDGATHPRVDGDGALHLSVAGDDVVFRRPVAYQWRDGARQAVDVGYRVARDGRVGFRVGRYDAGRPLVIDPVLALSSNLWGLPGGVALDPAGNIYVVGSVWSGGLPTVGGYAPQQAGTEDAYVVKLNPAGTTALYATYLGARRATTTGLAIAVDAAGSAYVTGTTSSTSFPITPGAYQAAGGTFITKLTPAGNALAYSTLFGPAVAAIAVHGDGSLALTGTTAGVTTTPGVLQPAKLGAQSPYVARLNATGTAMNFATWLGGTAADEARGVAVDGAGNTYVAGTARSSNFPTRNAWRSSRAGPSDAFVAKVNPTGTQLVYSTYIGGSGEERGFGLAVDSAGRAVVVGWTESFDFPATPGAFQPRMGGSLQGLSNAFITRLDASGASLAWSTYLGGGWCATSCFGFFDGDDGIDVATAVTVDAAGFTYVGGYATSARFPLVDEVQSSGLGGDVARVPFVARIRPNGESLVYASVIGPASSTMTLNQLAVDVRGAVVATGNSPIAPFPRTANALSGDGGAFVFKFAPGNYPTTLRSSPNPAGRTQSVTLVADVDAATPGGVITFSDGSTVLGTAVATNGAAALTVSLSPGVHRITAVNGLDGKVSPPLFQVVRGQ